MKPVRMLLCAIGLSCPLPALDHGGTYIGPGDLVPPAGGGGVAPSAPSAPAGPAAPGAPGASGPATPNAPATPGAVVIPANPRRPAQPAVTGGPPAVDLTTWEFWWELNKGPYLQLKANVHGRSETTGEPGVIRGLGAASTQRRSRAPTARQVRETVYPALEGALHEDGSKDLVSASLVAIAKVGSIETSRSAIRVLLSHRDQEISETAALALGILQDEAALPLLRELAADSPEGRRLAGRSRGVPSRSRIFALYGMGLIGQASDSGDLKQEIAETLWHRLAEDDSAEKDARVACVIALGILGLPAPEPTVERLAAYLRDREQDALVRAHCPTAMVKLLRSSGRDHGELRTRLAMDMLALLDDRETDRLVRQSCTQSLGRLVDADEPLAAEVFEALVSRKERSRDRQEQNYTAISLAQLAASAPGPIREKVTAYLAEQSRKGSTAYRPWAGLGLGVLGFHLKAQKAALPDSAVRSLRVAFLDTQDPSAKASFAIALGLAGAEEAADELRNAMESSRVESLRGYCAVALGLLGARAHRDSLTELIRSSRRRPQLLRQASIGLALTRDHRAAEVLLALLQGRDSGGASLSVMASVSMALGFIGDYRSVRPLVAVLQDERNTTPLGRAFAAAALGMVADKEPIRWNSKIAEDLNYRAAVPTLIDVSLNSGILDLL